MNERAVCVRIEDLELTLEHLHSEGYSYFSFMTAVDYPDHFLMVYGLVNTGKHESIIIEAPLSKEEPVAPSSTGIWKGAEWHEREVYDLFGITFEGHPDMRRMFLPEEFEGHPLRKDFQSDEVEKKPEDFY